MDTVTEVTATVTETAGEVATTVVETVGNVAKTGISMGNIGTVVAVGAALAVVTILGMGMFSLRNAVKKATAEMPTAKEVVDNALSDLAGTTA